MLSPSQSARNREIAVHCNCLGRFHPGGGWMAMQQRDGKFYDACGLRIEGPAESRPATLDEIVLEYEAAGVVIMTIPGYDPAEAA